MEVSKLDAAATAVAGGPSVPDDIIFDVLSRLSAKTLCRFRCVCKRWRALLSDPAFIAAQSSRAGPLVAAMFAASPSRVCEYDLRVMAPYGGGGEVLRSFRVSSMNLANTRFDVICVDQEWDGATIIDPASGRMLAAGAMPVDHGPAVSATTQVSDISFGRAAPSGAYKLVRFLESVAPRPGGGRWHRQKLCEVATIEINGGNGDAPPPPVTWRRRKAAPFLTSFNSDRKASVNGLLYFLHREFADLDDREPLRRWTRGLDLIAVFDLESETWKKAIDWPAMEEEEEDDGTPCVVTLAELKGALIMLHRKLQPRGSSDGCFATVWRLADHRRSVWVKQYAIQMPMNWYLTMAPLEVLGDGRVLLLSSLREEVEDERLRRGYRYKYRYVLQFYEPSTGVFADLMEMPEGFRSTMAVYTGSLLSSLAA